MKQLLNASDTNYRSTFFRTVAAMLIALAWANVASVQGPLQPLTPHGTAYVCLRHYFARRANSPLSTTDNAIRLKGFGGVFQLGSEDDSVKVACMLKEMTQNNDENTVAFDFDDSVTLLQKSDGPPTSWLVSSGSSQAWVPFYCLDLSELKFHR